MTDLIKFTPPQIALVKRTVAKDCNDTEFNLFLEMAKARGLNPLLRHIFAQVHNKEPRLNKEGKPYPNQKERQLVIVVSREGQRALAERTGAYRPDERAPRLVFDDTKKDKSTNPHGLVSAEVTVYKHTHGEWFPVTEIAYWEDYAPLVEIWEGKGEDRKATGRFELKGTWLKMGRIMLPKCAEMAALRKAFPDSFGGLYDEAEMDRGEILDLTPSEWADKADQDDRLAKIGGPNLFIVDWMEPGKPLDMVPGGQFTDRVLAYLKTCEGPGTVRAFADRNAVVLRQFWGFNSGEALELKREIEKAQALPVEDEQLEAAGGK